MTDYKLDAAAKYARTHEWVRMEDGLAVVGISDAAQDLLSDVVYVELPEEGAAVKAGDAVGVVESVKAAEDVNAPVSGVIAAVNRALVDAPETINEQPYQAWFFKIQPTGELAAELAKLLQPEEYDRFVAESS